jgi:hypothetical protein
MEFVGIAGTYGKGLGNEKEHAPNLGFHKEPRARDRNIYERVSYKN